MSEKRRGLGRGLGALIPNSSVATEEAVESEGAKPKGRPVDVFFPAAARPVSDESEAGTTARRGASSASQVAEVLRAPRKPAAPTRKGASQNEGSGGKDPVKSRSAGNGKKPSNVEAPAAIADEVAAEGAMTAVSDTAQSDPLQQADDAAVSRETLVEVPGARFAEVPVGSIHPNRRQPRTVFDEEDMAELVHSVREIGILQPIVVRPSSEQNDHDYELVMGERRWRAAQQAGLEAVPAIIRSTSDDDLLRDALLENLHRSQLNPLEEAAAYQQLLDDFGCTHDELADRIGRSRPQVSNMIRLMKLPPLVQRRVAAGVLSAGHARALLGLADPAEMEKLAQKIVAEGLSVRATEEIVALSDGLRRPKRENKPRLGARHERLDFLANSLSDRLDTSVKITLGAKKGRVSIEFASVDDLNRIMGVLNPSEN
ncbi:ParB/RepB/Spo0J family partition protein [Crystallibacter crystallopoietes]|nr:ParB/RepB/Spo0J family partition protein [Arthrobacter crystallopoietes]